MAKQQTPPQQYTPDWLASLDGRTSVRQVLNRRHSDLCADLGGFAVLSYQQRALVDRAIFLQYHLEIEEQKLATGGEFDSGRWVQACNSLSGIFKTLGLKRQAREVTMADIVKSAAK